ncbi:HlyU family transcriptional regulator [Psychromarinibacter sp. C21-152]|uniref:HlyU family transcriptional regulator n=1 Tax=Psychromarinibacter sediminicola TaxID=3033385 RepID=A0AAE3T929_9RHOB|nr:HlyU family transcriptional regulator [Psychromarinibacter sediminicola]MDF0600145.1 HlyU family transcriptional regulator [Psychromarinibacter sediminicola]
MSLLSRLFGGGGAGKAPQRPEPETHNDFLIFAEPAKAEGGYRIGALIEKEIGGEVKSHRMVRADTIQDHDTAVQASVAKAKALIDEQGESIFRD